MEWSYDLLTDDERDLLRLTSVFAGGFDLTSLCAVADGADEVDVLRHLDSLVRKSLVVADHTATRTRYSLFETIRQFAEDRLAEAGDARAVTRLGTPGTSRGRRPTRWEHWNGPGWRDAVDWVEVELGNLRAGYQWSARRGELEVATDIAAHAALMGFSVQLFETLAWAEELLEPATAADVRRLPRLYTARRLRVLRRTGRGRPRERAPGDRAGDRLPLRRVRARVRVVHRGARPACTAATSIATSSSPARWRERYGSDRGYGLAAYVDGLQSAAGSRRHSRSPRSPSPPRRSLGNPYWISYALWIAGMAFSKADVRRAFAAWDEGVAFVREHRVQFFEGFLARDAARLHTSDGEPRGRAGAVRRGHRRVPARRQRAAARSSRWPACRRCSSDSTVPRPAAMLLGALSREPSSFHHVPELARARRPRPPHARASSAPPS